MKRPLTFYMVAGWCGLALLVQASYLTRSMRAVAAGEPTPTIWAFLPLILLALAVWQTVGLIQLKRFHRWLAVVFFVYWAVTLTWNIAIVIRRPGVELVRPVLFLSMLVALNLLSAWYLLRRSFRDFAAQFVAMREKERHSQDMQKASQKKILDDIRS